MNRGIIRLRIGLRPIIGPMYRGSVGLQVGLCYRSIIDLGDLGFMTFPFPFLRVPFPFLFLVHSLGLSFCLEFRFYGFSLSLSLS